MIHSDTQVSILSRVLDAAALRHQVIAQNVANVNTPGFQRQDVAFADVFTEALEKSDPREAGRVQPRIIRAEGGTVRQDGNNVDIDVEMGRLQQNALSFQVFLQIMSTRINQMRSAISGR